MNDAEVLNLLSDIAACTAIATRIVFTHAIPSDRKALQLILRLIGEPFKSAIRSEDLLSYVNGTGWTVISDVDRDTAHGIERYAVAERC